MFSFTLSALLFAEQASAHGRLTRPMARIGSDTAYENNPIGFPFVDGIAQGPMTQFACRHGPNSNLTPFPVTAGDELTIEWDLTANHRGDAGIYISYDSDVSESNIHEMQFFKIANIPKARDFKKSLGKTYPITLPSWLPAGKATLRWEWYALHVNPTIEVYAQCAPIMITSTGNAVGQSDIAMYPVVDSSGNTKTLPLYNTGFRENTGTQIYRDAFDTANSPQWMAGPACARGYTGNDCGLTAVGTQGNIDPATGARSGGNVIVNPSTPSPVQSTPSPVDTPTDEPMYNTPSPVDTPTDEPTYNTPSPTVDDDTCSHQVEGLQCTTTGEAGIEACCAAGTYCHVYSDCWSSCTLGDGSHVMTTTTTEPATTTDVAPAPATPSPVDTPTDEPMHNTPCTCVSIVAHIGNAWCAANNCDPVYADFCALSCDGTTPTPTTAQATPTPTTAQATPTPTNAQATPTPTNAQATPTPTNAQATTGTPATTTGSASTDEFVIMGYVENWKSFADMSKYDDYTHLLYSFLTLDSAPYPDAPRDIQWDGQAIYETMTLADVLDVMQLCDGCAAYENPNNWMRQRIVALMDYCTANGKTFLWAFGGWSDLKRTIGDDQVDTLVAMLVELLETVGGDGIDFDWEHLSEYKDIDNAVHAQQRQIVGKVIVALKDALAARGMADKLITYTPRYNAFLEGGAYNTNQFKTDGEGIDIVEYVVANSDFGVDAIDFVHYMMYDINAQEGFQNAPEQYFVMEHYDAVIQSSLDYIPASKIVMGFESGPQAYTGVSGGIDHEKAIIAAIKDRVGGIMFWAANEAAIASNGQTTGANSGTLAAYAACLVGYTC